MLFFAAFVFGRLAFVPIGPGARADFLSWKTLRDYV